MAPGLLFGVSVEFLFKRHFWIIHLLFIFGVMLMVARTGNAFIESMITPLPQGKAKSQLQKAAPTAGAALDADKIAKLLGMPKPVPEVAVIVPTSEDLAKKNAEKLSGEPVHTPLRVKLLGTLLAGLPEWSIASIQDAVTLKTATYMVGDKVQTAEITEIERARVIVINNGRREFIDATPGDGGGVAVPVVVAPKAPDTSAPKEVALGNGIKAISENEYEVPRGEIDKTLSNLNDVAMQARIVPAFKDGVAQGFKLFSIRPDSIYTKIGVQNGDVIKRINGYDLNSPEKALEVYSKLKEAGRIDIELDRNGSNVRKTYNVR